MTNKDLLIECDMLKGNINRMMVTDDSKELESMYIYALRRINQIYKVRHNELAENKKDGQ